MRFPNVTLATFKPLTLIDMPDEEVLIRNRMLRVKTDGRITTRRWARSTMLKAWSSIRSR
jgi:hypothetical protein